MATLTASQSVIRKVTDRLAELSASGIPVRAVCRWIQAEAVETAGDSCLEFEDNPYWKGIEGVDCVTDEGETYHFLLYAPAKYFSGNDVKYLNEWLKLARIAGGCIANQVSIGGGEFATIPSPVTRWVWSMLAASRSGAIPTGVRVKPFDMEGWLRLQASGEDAGAIEDMGEEAIFDDIVLASTLWADFLAGDRRTVADTEEAADKNVENEHTPPPPFDAASRDWIMSPDLADKINETTTTMNDYRKPSNAKADGEDDHGRWGVDCIGAFRRKVGGSRNVAYYIPTFSPLYRGRLERARNGGS